MTEHERARVLARAAVVAARARLVSTEHGFSGEAWAVGAHRVELDGANVTLKCPSWCPSSPREEDVVYMDQRHV